MDTFIGELTNMLSRRNEETVLVMYGDHLPTFNFTNDTMENGDIYQTEYFIWSNYGLEKKDIDLQAYQLSAAVFDTAFRYSYHCTTYKLCIFLLFIINVYSAEIIEILTAYTYIILISSTMIRVPKRSIKSGDEIAIAQRGNDKIELGRTTYIVPN